MTKKTLFFILLIATIIYLLIGVAFYVNDVRYSRSAIHICPEGATTGEQVRDCPPQTVSLKEDWPTAITLMVGWLPLLIMRAVDG